MAARLFCVSGQVSGACFTVGLSQSPQVMPRSQEHSTPAPGRVLAHGLALRRVEAPLPLFQERALGSWPWAETGSAPAWGWMETHGHVLMGPWGSQETGLPCPLYLGNITSHPSPPSSLGPPILCPYNEGTAEAIPNIPIPNLPSPSSQDPQPSLLPPTGGSRLVVHTVYLLSSGVLQTTGWGGMGKGREFKRLRHK